jgi:hypothetical protein
MVSRVLLPLSLLSTTSAFQIADTHSHVDYDGMKAAMLSMAKHAEKNGIDGATITAMEGFLDTINNRLLTALEADRSHSQQILDDANNAVNSCNANRASWASDVFPTLNTAVTDAQNTHRDCRNQEIVTYGTLSSQCQVLEDRVCGWTVCGVPDFSNGDSDAVDNYITCLQDFFAEHRDHYYTERTNCIDATNAHHEQTTLCDSNQETFEADYCDREARVAQRCQQYEGCRCAAEEEFESIKGEVQSLEEIFQTQFVALQHLLCYGQQILNNSTDMAFCDQIGEADTSGDECSHYADCPRIVYPEPDAFVDCNEIADTFPCEATFLNVYGTWIDSFAPVDDCNACTFEDVATRFYADDGARKGDYAVCPMVLGR